MTKMMQWKKIIKVQKKNKKELIMMWKRMKILKLAGE
jgi:hypothetical protein